MIGNLIVIAIAFLAGCGVGAWKGDAPASRLDELAKRAEDAHADA